MPQRCVMARRHRRGGGVGGAAAYVFDCSCCCRPDSSELSISPFTCSQARCQADATHSLATVHALTHTRGKVDRQPTRLFDEGVDARHAGLRATLERLEVGAEASTVECVGYLRHASAPCRTVAACCSGRRCHVTERTAACPRAGAGIADCVGIPYCHRYGICSRSRSHKQRTPPSVHDRRLGGVCVCVLGGRILVNNVESAEAFSQCCGLALAVPSMQPHVSQRVRSAARNAAQSRAVRYDAHVGALRERRNANKSGGATKATPFLANGAVDFTDL